MLSQPDAALARRDPNLSGLATLFNPQAFVDLLRHASCRIETTSADCQYIRYKPRISCMARYTIQHGGRSVDVYAKAYAANSRSKLEKVRQRVTVPSLLGPGQFFDKELGLAICVFPNDVRLRTLQLLADPESQRQLLQKVLPNHSHFWDGKLQTLRYKPERRYVAQLSTVDGPQAVLKFYARNRFPFNTGKIFKSRGLLRVPRQLARSNRRTILIYPWLEGELLSNLTTQSTGTGGRMSRVGAALAELHAQAGRRLQYITPSMKIRKLEQVVADIAYLCPDLAGQLQTLTRRVADKLVELPPAVAAVHGDFYAKQVLLTDHDVSILDFDEAARGDPMSDLGNFAAHLYRDVFRGRLPADRLEPMLAAFWDGYRHNGNMFHEGAVVLYTVIGLLCLAPHPFRQREPNWPDRIRTIVEHAQGLFQSVSSTPFAAPIPHQSSGGQTAVIDPFDVRRDKQMPFLNNALDPGEVQRAFARSLPCVMEKPGQYSLRTVRVLQYKPQRRCQIEYVLESWPAESLGHATILLGKARAKGLNPETFNVMVDLWKAGFHATSADGVSIAEPIAVLPQFEMWMERKVQGKPATELLTESTGIELSGRLAEAIYKLHQIDIPTDRSHTMADEMRILHEQLALVAESRPEWTSRIASILDACDDLARQTPVTIPVGIHREFCSDHVLVDGTRLYLVDLKRYCLGDPALDIGHFCGHLIEQSLRNFGRHDWFRGQENAFVERYVEIAGESVRSAINAYTVLTLVGHIQMSMECRDRQHTTPALLELCEQLLNTPNLYPSVPYS